MSVACRRIAAADRDWHGRFFHFAASVFTGLDAAAWMRWRDRGGWQDAYEVFAFVDGERILGTIGRTRMRLAIDGVQETGYQLGAVATLPAFRGRGMARRLMQWVLDELDAPDQAVFLFGNDSVLDFYPRFGFRRVPQQRWTLRAEIAPSTGPATPFDPDNAADRQGLAELCARATAIAGPLATRDYFPIALWHLTCQPIAGFWLDGRDALVATSVEQGRLVIHDIIEAEPSDLRPFLPGLITGPVAEVEFRLDPSNRCAGARPFAIDDATSPLFVRGAPSIVGPLGFPGLAQT